MAETLLSANYTIKRVLELNQFLNVYVGEKKNSETVVPVIINEVCNRNLINQWITELAGIEKSKSPDFMEYFSEDSKLYVVFSYTSGKNIKKYIESENLNISYRMVLFKHVLHTFLQYANYPAFICVFMMNHKNIVIQNNAVHFNFSFFASDEEGTYTEEKFFEVLGRLFALFFSPLEIEKNNKLSIVGEKCNKNLYSSVAEVIRDIDDAAGSMDKEEALKLALVEKKKKMKALLAKGVTLCMVLAAGCMAYSRYKEANSQVFQYHTVEAIGTVDVREAAEKQQAEEQAVIHVTTARALLENPEGSIEAVDVTEESNQTQQQRKLLTDAEEYTVMPRDSLYIICLEKYKDISYINALAEINGLSNRNLIFPGQTLKLPSTEVLKELLQRNTVFEEDITEDFVQPTSAETNMEINPDEYELLLEEEDYGNTVG